MANQSGNCGICILAGGLSGRMGRDKAGLRLGSTTLLGHIRAEAGTLGLPVRIIRRDLVPRCGPLGGVYTALKTSQAEAEIFLACDMPFVSARLLERLLDSWRAKRGPAFLEGKLRVVSSESQVPGSEFQVGAGFPFLLPVAVFPKVEQQVVRKQFSLQKLAQALEARLIPLRGRDWELFNVNTQTDWLAARQRWRLRGKKEFARVACK